MIIQSDWHIHSESSYDAVIPLEEIASNAKKFGFKKVGITDHLNLNDHKFLGDLKNSAESVTEFQKNHPEVVLGVELNPIQKPEFDYIAKHGTNEGYVPPVMDKLYDIELALTKEELIGTVDTGDVLKISLNQNNEIQEITHIYDYSAKKFVQTNPYEPQTGAGYRSANRCFHGYAYDITDGLLRFCKNLPTGSEKPETENALLSGFEIYVIDGSEIYVGSENDIKDYTGAGNACSEIIVATQWANPVNIVVIK